MSPLFATGLPEDKMVTGGQNMDDGWKGDKDEGRFTDYT
jgi:hypothetical protein